MKKTQTIILLAGLIALLSFCGVSGKRASRAGRRDFCQLSPERGTCRGSSSKWYYDSSSGECKTFIYGGCRGNNNRFATKTACERMCQPAACRYDSCSRTCPNGFIIDADGCNTCRCQPGPEQASCPAIECPDRCLHGYQTDSDGCMTCDCLSEPAQTPISRTRPQRQCPPVCYMYCQYGNKKDEHGCDICKCNSKEEACGSEQCMMECPTGFVTDNRGCELCECKATADAEPSCPTNACLKKCAFGFQKDSFGCDVCVCATSRPRNRQASDCSNRPMCSMFCPNGFLKGRDGCDICSCANRRTIQRQSTRNERPSGKRVSTDDGCGVRPMCAMHCQDGFQKDSKGCDTCTCRQNPPVRPAQLPAGNTADSPAQQPSNTSSQVPAQLPANIPSQQPDGSPAQIPASVPNADCSPKRCHKRMSCSFGFAKDEFGCDTCICNSSRTRSVSKGRSS